MHAVMKITNKQVLTISQEFWDSLSPNTRKKYIMKARKQGKIYQIVIE